MSRHHAARPSLRDQREAALASVAFWRFHASRTSSPALRAQHLDSAWAAVVRLRALPSSRTW